MELIESPHTLDLQAIDPYYKAAMLMVALDQACAIEVIHLLNKDEVKQVFHWMDQESALTSEQTELLVADFYRFSRNRTND